MLFTYKIVPLSSCVYDSTSQPREVREEKVADMATSIQEEGLRNPVHGIERPDGKLFVFNGEHRLRACEKLKWDQIPVLVYDEMSDEAMFNSQVMDNVARFEPSPMENIRAFDKSHHTYGTPIATMAKKFCVSASTIKADLPLVTLPKGLHQLIDDGKLSKDLARSMVDLVGNYSDEKILEAYRHASRATNAEKQKERLKGWLTVQEQNQTAVEQSVEDTDHTERKTYGRALAHAITAFTALDRKITKADIGYEKYLDGALQFKAKEVKDATRMPNDLEIIKTLLGKIDLAITRFHQNKELA
jgi:ParB family chromosome partitioning protein